MIFGFDVSTSIIGVCVLKDDGTPYEFSYVDLRKKKSLCDKANAFHDHLYDWGLHRSHKSKIFIEDKLSGFSGGRTSQQTMMKLAAFNGIAQYIAFKKLQWVEPIPIHPSTVKATMKKDGLIIPRGSDKKKLTLDFVKDVVVDFPYVETRNGNPQPHCYDMADAYCVARAGYLKQL